VKVIAGLGNPGKKYAKTRHNVGYMVADLLAKEYSIEFKKQSNRLIEISEVTVYNQRIFILKPMSFMNVSGAVLSKFIKYKNVNLNNFLVIYDDIALGLGQIKIKPRGGSGGHNGVESIITSIGSKNFPRLRVGIGHPGDPELVSKYVLTPVKSKQEDIKLENSTIKAKEALDFWIKHSIDEVMNKFN